MRDPYDAFVSNLLLPNAEAENLTTGADKKWNYPQGLLNVG